MSLPTPPPYPRLLLENARGDDDYEDLIATLTLAATDVVRKEPEIRLCVLAYLSDALWYIGEPKPGRPDKLSVGTPIPARDSIIVAAGILCMLHAQALEKTMTEETYAILRSDVVVQIKNAWKALVYDQVTF